MRVTLAPATEAAAPPRFWPHFLVPAVLVPAMWTLLQGLAGPDGVIMFYLISLSAIPIAFSLVLLPGWRLARRSSAALAAVVAVLMLPSAAVLLWGVYCAVWLGILVLTGEF